MPVLRLYKSIGRTPLEVINEYKDINKTTIEKISYAGRLDPMAEGQLLVLTNQDCLRQNDYHNLDKTYRFEIMFGISTDTYDMLGIIEQNTIINSDNSLADIMEYIAGYVGKHIQPYPPFSSVRVDGNPLWYYARNGTLDTITIPEKSIEIYSSEIIEKYVIDSELLKANVIHNINQVSQCYNFRQNAIKERWRCIKLAKYPVIHIEMRVSSGTYIRVICRHIEEMFGIPAMILSINRSRI